jgi:hypothetical protein
MRKYLMLILASLDQTSHICISFVTPSDMAPWLSAEKQRHYGCALRVLETSSRPRPIFEPYVGQFIETEQMLHFYKTIISPGLLMCPFASCLRLR